MCYGSGSGSWFISIKKGQKQIKFFVKCCASVQVSISYPHPEPAFQVDVHLNMIQGFDDHSFTKFYNWGKKFICLPKNCNIFIQRTSMLHDKPPPLKKRTSSTSKAIHYFTFFFVCGPFSQLDLYPDPVKSHSDLDPRNINYLGASDS